MLTSGLSSYVLVIPNDAYTTLSQNLISSSTLSQHLIGCSTNKEKMQNCLNIVMFKVTFSHYPI